MLEDTNASDGLVRLLLITMPGPAIAVAGDWRGRGLCVGEDPDMFFPCHSDPGARARDTCAACAVRNDCLDYSIDADELGVWGVLKKANGGT